MHYDPNGFRVEKVGSKGKIHYVPLLNGEVGYRKEFSTNAEYSFVYVGIQHLARVNGVISGSGKKFYYHNDHLGSALAITDEYGNKVVERDFTPFGERINTDVYDDEPKDPDEDESGFTGKDWDDDVGLYYYNARWYDPAVGRFISEDSVADDPNLYGYCGQNPINYTDPTGRFKVGLVNTPIAVTGAILGAAAILTGDSNLGMAATAFSLFVAIDYKIKKAQLNEALKQMAEANEPAPDPVKIAENASTPDVLESGGQGEGTGGNAARAANPDETVTPASNSSEVKKLTVNDLIEKIRKGEDINKNIHELMKEYNVAPEDALKVIREAVKYVVSKLPKDDQNKGFVELPFNSNNFYELLGLRYGIYYGDLKKSGWWGTPTFVEQIMVIGLYWNYLNPVSYLAFGDLTPLTPAVNVHSEHRLGTDVDIKVIWNNVDITNIKPTGNGYNLKLFSNTEYQNFGKSKVQEFINMVHSIYPNTFGQVIWCDWTVKGVQKTDKDLKLRYNHRNHIHLGYAWGNSR